MLSVQLLRKFPSGKYFFSFLVFPLFSIVLVESIPEGVEFNSSTMHPSIFQAWLGLMNEAQSSIDIASFYWTLTNSDTGTHEPTAEQVSWSCGVSGSETFHRIGSVLKGLCTLFLGWDHSEEASSALRETVCSDCSEQTSGGWKRWPQAPQQLRWL